MMSPRVSRLRPSSWILAALLATSTAACAKQGSDSAAPAKQPATTAAETKTPPPADARKPHGWRAYSGKTATDVAATPAAADATVYDTAGKAVKLSSFWNKGKTVLVFYRGHW